MFAFGQYKHGNDNDIVLHSKLVPLIGNFTESEDQNSFFGYGAIWGKICLRIAPVVHFTKLLIDLSYVLKRAVW